MKTPTRKYGNILQAITSLKLDGHLNVNMNSVRLQYQMIEVVILDIEIFCPIWVYNNSQILYFQYYKLTVVSQMFQHRIQYPNRGHPNVSSYIGMSQRRTCLNFPQTQHFQTHLKYLDIQDWGLAVLLQRLWLCFIYRWVSKCQHNCFH